MYLAYMFIPKNRMSVYTLILADIWTADCNFEECDSIIHILSYIRHQPADSNCEEMIMIPILCCNRGTQATDDNFSKMITLKQRYLPRTSDSNFR